MRRKRKLSLILLSWKRPENIPVILDSILSYNRINEIILWNNNPSLQLLYTDKKLSVFNSQKNYGLTIRYYLAGIAENENIMFIDDDLCYKKEQIEKIFRAYCKDNSRLYGTFGRNLKNFRYNFENAKGEVDIILGRTIMFSKKYLSNFFKNLGQWQGIIEDDILFSLSFKKKHQVVDVGEIKELPSNDALWYRPDHLLKRQEMVNFCLKTIPGLKSKLENV